MLNALRHANLLGAGAGVASVHLTGEQADFLLNAGLLPEKSELIKGEIWGKDAAERPALYLHQENRRRS